MLNYIWGALILVSIVCAIATGRVNELSNSITDGAASAISLVISLCGMMCFFSGLMKIADKSGITKVLARVFSPVLSRLFPEYKKESPAFKAICMNITANLLGLGNAATPFGIRAMKLMNEQNSTRGIASNSMVTFVVMNTASLQLIPTMMSAMRSKYGAGDPFDVLPAIWMSSVCALLVGVFVAKVMELKNPVHNCVRIKKCK